MERARAIATLPEDGELKPRDSELGKSGQLPTLPIAFRLSPGSNVKKDMRGVLRHLQTALVAAALSTAVDTQEI